jgi:hypothetical protein
MKTWLWILLIGGIITYLAYQYRVIYAYITGLITALLVWNSYKAG